MTEAETVKLLEVIDVCYNREKVMDKDSLKIKIALWYNSFKDYDFKLVFNLLQQYIEMGTSFPPLIKDLKDIHFRSIYKIPMAGEAWDNLLRNIRKHGIYDTLAGIDKLDELTKKALKSIGGYTYLCCSENVVSDRARFIDSYNEYYIKQREEFIVGHLQKAISGDNENGQMAIS